MFLPIPEILGFSVSFVTFCSIEQSILIMPRTVIMTPGQKANTAIKRIDNDSQHGHTIVFVYIHISLERSRLTQFGGLQLPGKITAAPAPNATHILHLTATPLLHHRWPSKRTREPQVPLSSPFRLSLGFPSLCASSETSQYCVCGV